MLYIQPRKIEALDANQYKVYFLRVKDGTHVEHTFTFSDNPRGISDYDKEFHFDTQDDPAETWLSRALLSFDKVRQLGVSISNDTEKLMPISLSVEEDIPYSSLYSISFATGTGQKEYSVNVAGDLRNREATWDFGSCKTGEAVRIGSCSVLLAAFASELTPSPSVL